MIAANASEIAERCNGKLLVPGDVSITELSTDSRKIKGGEAYLALSGEKFDGNNFARAAIEAGAKLLILSKQDLASEIQKEAELAGCPLILVPDGLIALQELARSERRIRAQRGDLKVICITGSSGKTSTKDLCATALSAKYQVSATQGNLNNHIGLPLSILATNEDDRAVVWEIGMNHAGEIAPLAEIAAPDVAIITNIGSAHIEHLGSREAIAREKGALLEALSAQATAILPYDDDYYELLCELSPCPVLSVSSKLSKDADIQLQKVQLHAEGTSFSFQNSDRAQEVSLPLFGEHMAGNAGLAMAAVQVLGVSPSQSAQALAAVEISPGRLEKKVIKGIHFLDDSYNANPESMRAALDTLSAIEVEGRRIAVLGKMGELGEQSLREHQDLGRYLSALPLDQLYSVGEDAAEISSHSSPVPAEHCDSHEDCADKLASQVGDKDLILLKGSRAAAMETILETFTPTCFT